MEIGMLLPIAMAGFAMLSIAMLVHSFIEMFRKYVKSKR